MINLKTPINAVDADGTIINGKEGKPPALKEICLYALRQSHNSDQQLGFKAKNERYLLAKRMDKLDEIELTEAEVIMLKNRIGMLFLQVDIVGIAGELLDGVQQEVVTEAPVGASAEGPAKAPTTAKRKPAPKKEKAQVAAPAPATP